MRSSGRANVRTKPRRRHSAWRIFFGCLAIVVASLAIKAPGRRGLAPAPEAGPEDKLILPAAAHEGADLSRRFIGGAFGLLMLSLAIVSLGVLWLLPWPSTDRTLNAPLPTYPEPRLQPSPRQEMQRFLAAEHEQLTTYGWVDKAHQIVHIPIDVAMNRVAQSGIPGWPASAKQAAGGSAVAAGSSQ